MILKLNETKGYPMVYKTKNTETGLIVELVNLEPIEANGQVEVESGTTLFHVTNIIEKRKAKGDFEGQPIPDFYIIELKKVGIVQYNKVYGEMVRTVTLF